MGLNDLSNHQRHCSSSNMLPAHHDVVEIAKHPGLLYARGLAAQRWRKYARLEKDHSPEGRQSRETLVTEIIELVRERGGNFKERGADGSWSVMPESSARRMILDMFLLEEDVPGRPSNHPGQVALRKLVAENSKMYFMSERTSSTLTGSSTHEIVEGIIESVENSGGKFKTMCEDGAWMVVPKATAREKIWVMFASYKKKHSSCNRDAVNESFLVLQDKIQFPTQRAHHIFNTTQTWMSPLPFEQTNASNESPSLPEISGTQKIRMHPPRGPAEAPRGWAQQPPFTKNPPKEERRTPHQSMDCLVGTFESAKEPMQDFSAEASTTNNLHTEKSAPWQREELYVHNEDALNVKDPSSVISSDMNDELSAIFDYRPEPVDLQSHGSTILRYIDKFANEDQTKTRKRSLMQVAAGLYGDRPSDTDSSEDASKMSLQTILSVDGALIEPPAEVSSPGRRHRNNDHNMGQSPVSSAGLSSRDASMVLTTGGSRRQSAFSDSDAAAAFDELDNEKCIRRAAGVYSSEQEVRKSSTLADLSFAEIQVGSKSELTDSSHGNDRNARRASKNVIVTSISFEPSVKAPDRVGVSPQHQEGTAGQPMPLPDVSAYGCVRLEERTPETATGTVHMSASSIHKMATNSHDVQVQARCLEELLFLASTSQGASVCHEGCIQDVVCSMQRHEKENVIQDLGCSILEALVWNHDSPILAEIQRAKGIERIMYAMEAYPCDLSIQNKGCHAIAALAFYDEGRKNDIAAVGGVEILVGSLRNHKREPEIVNGCCAALARLGYNNFINQAKTHRADGISAVLDAMSLHREHSTVQRSCCYALALLASNCHVLAQTEVILKGGIRSVLDAVEWHRKDATILKSCCDVLIMLAMKNVDNQKRIGTEGGIEALLQGVKDHRDQSSQQWCFEALAWAASESALNQERIAAGDGSALVIKGMELHTDDAEVQYWGCEVLTLVCNAQMTTKAIDAVVNAMREHHSEAEIQNVACKALTSFEHAKASNRKLIVEKGGFRALKAAVKNHPKDSDSKSICALLTSLSLANREQKRKCRLLGVTIV